METKQKIFFEKKVQVELRPTYIYIIGAGCCNKKIALSANPIISFILV